MRYWVREESLDGEERTLARLLGSFGLIPVMEFRERAYYAPALGAFLTPKDRCWGCLRPSKTWPLCSKECHDRFREFLDSHTSLRISALLPLEGAQISVSLPSQALLVLGPLILNYGLSLEESLRMIIAVGTQVLETELRRTREEHPEIFKFPRKGDVPKIASLDS